MRFGLLGCALASVLVLASCGGSGRAPFSASDLPGLVHDPPGTPDGVDYRTTESHVVSLADIVGGAGDVLVSRRRRLRTIGFERAYGRTFASTGIVSKPSYGAVAVAVLFRDEAGAAAGLQILAQSERRAAVTVGKDLRAVPPTGLGDGAWGFRVELLDGRLVTYGLRVRNVVLLVAMGGQDGSFVDSDARDYARQIEQRASL